jgi:hypothetical protein
VTQDGALTETVYHTIMTLTPREYLHQLLGRHDQRWIDSLTDARCGEIAGIISKVQENVRLAFNAGEYEGWR